MFIYLRYSMAHEVVRQIFGLSDNLNENLLHEIVLLLQELLSARQFVGERRLRRAVPSLQVEKIDGALVDSFEVTIPHLSNTDRQRQRFSSKGIEESFVLCEADLREEYVHLIVADERTWIDSASRIN